MQILLSFVDALVGSTNLFEVFELLTGFVSLFFSFVQTLYNSGSGRFRLWLGFHRCHWLVVVRSLKDVADIVFFCLQILKKLLSLMDTLIRRADVAQIVELFTGCICLFFGFVKTALTRVVRCHVIRIHLGDAFVDEIEPVFLVCQSNAFALFLTKNHDTVSGLFNTQIDIAFAVQVFQRIHRVLGVIRRKCHLCRKNRRKNCECRRLHDSPHNVTRRERKLCATLYCAVENPTTQSKYQPPIGLTMRINPPMGYSIEF